MDSFVQVSDKLVLPVAKLCWQAVDYIHSVEGQAMVQSTPAPQSAILPGSSTSAVSTLRSPAAAESPPSRSGDFRNLSFASPHPCDPFIL